MIEKLPKQPLSKGVDWIVGLLDHCHCDAFAQNISDDVLQICRIVAHDPERMRKSSESNDGSNLSVTIERGFGVMLSTVSTCSRCKVFSKQTSIPHTHSRSLTASHVKGMKPLIAIHPSKPSPTFATQSDLAHPGTKLVESDPLLSTEKEIEYDDYEENEVEEESSVDQDLEPNAYEEKQPPEDELSMSEEQTLQIGDEVVIRVKNFHPLGVIVKIVNHPGVEG